MKADSFSMRLAAVAASLGLLSFGVAALVGSLSQAHAQSLGPEVTGGTQPYVSVTGSFTSTASATTTTVYTVPPDRILVVTCAIVDSTGTWQTSPSLYQDTTLKMGSRYLSALSCAGNGRLVFDPGTTVVIGDITFDAANPTFHSVGYFIQGYLAHP